MYSIAHNCAEMAQLLAYAQATMYWLTGTGVYMYRLMPPGKYDRSIFVAAAMWPYATITLVVHYITVLTESLSVNK